MAAGSIAAAAIAGLPILIGFFVWHWFNIAPVWGVLIEASISFPLAVFCISWAWRLSREAARFDGWRGGLAFGALFVAGLVIEESIGLARGRPPSPTTAAGVLVEVVFAAIPVVPVALAGWRIVGDADAHIRKLRELAKVGVSQFNVYLMNGDEEEQLRLYGEKIIPTLRDVRPAAIA